jgi:hypothetical protein
VFQHRGFPVESLCYVVYAGGEVFNVFNALHVKDENVTHWRYGVARSETTAIRQPKEEY